MAPKRGTQARLRRRSSRLAENSFYASRALSADGRRLFFEAADPLCPATPTARDDVYQWEAPGKGGCTTPTPTYSPQTAAAST